jgi:branched-chain amino acid transport system permease protein
MLLYSIVLICVMLFRPTGLLGRSEFSLAGFIAKMQDKRAGKKKPAADKEG